MAKARPIHDNKTPAPANCPPFRGYTSQQNTLGLKYSIVNPISKIDFGPAHTTLTGVLPNSVKSAETSIVYCPSRCTPPSPPVAKTLIPARCDKIIVSAIVVPPFNLLAITYPISRLDTFTALRNCSKLSSPTCGTPSIKAQVAGTTPLSRNTCSTLLAISMFCGYGNPWEMIVDSKETTGRFSNSACLTSCDIRKSDRFIVDKEDHRKIITKKFFLHHDFLGHHTQLRIGTLPLLTCQPQPSREHPENVQQIMSSFDYHPYIPQLIRDFKASLKKSSRRTWWRILECFPKHGFDRLCVQPGNMYTLNVVGRRRAYHLLGICQNPGV